MTRYYEISDEERRERHKKNVETVESSLSHFFITKKVKSLRDSFDSFKFYGVGSNFIDFLWEKVRGIHMGKSFPNECKNYELEVKLVSEKMLETWRIGYGCKLDGWILGSYDSDYVTNNLYFFENKLKTITLVGAKKGFNSSKIYRVKKKGPNILVGNVLKRTEEEFDGTLDVLFREVKRGKYVGALTEEEHSWKFLNELTGRVFEVCHSSAHVFNHPALKIAPQLEVEYKGFIPGFSDFKEGEKEVVGDLEDLAAKLSDKFKLYHSKKTKLDALKEVLS